jgi:hypothetical protein
MRRMQFTWIVLFCIFCSVLSGCDNRKQGDSKQVVNSANISQTQIIQKTNDVIDKEKKDDWGKATNTKGKYTDLNNHDKPLP